MRRTYIMVDHKRETYPRGAAGEFFSGMRIQRAKQEGAYPMPAMNGPTLAKKYARGWLFKAQFVSSLVALLLALLGLAEMAAEPFWSVILVLVLLGLPNILFLVREYLRE